MKLVEVLPVKRVSLCRPPVRFRVRNCSLYLISEGRFLRRGEPLPNGDGREEGGTIQFIITCSSPWISLYIKIEKRKKKKSNCVGSYGWIERATEQRVTEQWSDGATDGQSDGAMERQMDRWTDRRSK